MTDFSEQLEELLSSEADRTSDLMTFVYSELRKLAESMMRSERRHHTLQATALVHEAYLRLVDQDDLAWDGRSHFFAAAAEAMRRILVEAARRRKSQMGRLRFLEAAAVTMRRVLVDHARGRDAAKRGGEWQRITLQGVDVSDSETEDIDLVQLDESLEKLAALDERQARIVELRFFAGLTGEEIAELLGISRPTVVRELAMARAWLRKELDHDDG